MQHLQTGASCNGWSAAKGDNVDNMLSTRRKGRRQEKKGGEKGKKNDASAYLLPTYTVQLHLSPRFQTLLFRYERAFLGRRLGFFESPTIDAVRSQSAKMLLNLFVIFFFFAPPPSLAQMTDISEGISISSTFAVGQLHSAGRVH